MWERLKDILLYVPLKIWESLLGALGAVLSAIPVPDFINNIPNIVSSIPSYVWYWVDPFNVPVGLSIILGAYVIRFGIRRIPIIG